MADTIKLAVLASRSGSNLNGILRAIDEGWLNAQVVGVYSNNRNAGALELAREAGLHARHFGYNDYDSPEEYETAIADELFHQQAEFIVCCGYLLSIGPTLLDLYRNRIFNIHPSLLPAFGGIGMFGWRVQRAALDHGVKITGVTVHLVDEGYNTGPIILQRGIAVHPLDTVQTLTLKTFAVEMDTYWRVIQLFAEGRVYLEGRRAFITDKEGDAEAVSVEDSQASEN